MKFTANQPNNFGAIRLLLAALVILSHSSELIDGNRSRELLTQLFGSLSFGELAVDGFFLVSGFLVAKSFVDSRSGWEFLLKRILRIYPAFIVSFLICVFLLGPMVGGAPLTFAEAIGRLVLLHGPPSTVGAFVGTFYPLLNSPMWTIAYEFRCYLLILVVGSIGLLSKRAFVLCASGAALLLYALHEPHFPVFGASLIGALIGEPDMTLRFIGIFGCGSLFFFYRDMIVYRGIYAAVAALLLLFLVGIRPIAEPAIATLGAYVLFWFAFNVRFAPINAVGRRTDISYGVYLYGWPIQKTLLWILPGLAPWMLVGLALPLAALFGLASWTLIERPSLSLKKSYLKSAGSKTPPIGHQSSTSAPGPV